MRSDLAAPPIDPTVALQAVGIAEELYGLHQTGLPVEEGLKRLSALCGVEVDRSALKGAFGSVPAESFAKDLLASRLPCPTGLSKEELIELIQAVCEVRGEEWQSTYWLRCLEANTGCPEIIDLIYYPADVLGPDDGREELSPEEVLAEAAKRPRRVLLTPPPE
jgi:hypothetical protein